MDPFFHTGLSISDSLKTVRKSVLIYETIIIWLAQSSGSNREENGKAEINPISASLPASD